MEPTKEIDTTVIQLQRYVIFLCSYMFGGVALTLVCGLVSHSLALIFVGLGVFMLAPLLFSSQFRGPFSKKARLRFFPDRLSIDLINKDSDMVERTNEFPFAEIVSFRTGDSSKDDSSFISLRLRDGRKFNYSFLEQRQGDGSDDVTPSLEEYIRAYNRSPDQRQKIGYMPSMLASQGGKNLLTGLTVVAAVCVVIHIVVNPKSIPYSILGWGAMYLLLLMQRKSDIARYKAMESSDGDQTKEHPKGA